MRATFHAGPLDGGDLELEVAEPPRVLELAPSAIGVPAAAGVGPSVYVRVGVDDRSGQPVAVYRYGPTIYRAGRRAA